MIAGLSITVPGGIRVLLVRYTSDGDRLVASASKLSLSRKDLGLLLELDTREVDEWIRETLRRAHFSPWEHSSYTWIAEGCSRVCSHQLVRHRVASYTQQSMRYTEGVLRGIALEASRLLGEDCPSKPGKNQESMRTAYSCYSRVLDKASRELDTETQYGLAIKAYVVPPSIKREALVGYVSYLLGASSHYYRLLSHGVPREDARFIIPHSVRTRIIVTMNARELIQSFLPLRMCTRAQWEIRRVAWGLWSLLMRVHPRLFKWAGPRCVMGENLQRREPVELADLAAGREEFMIEACPELVPRKGIRACLLSAMRDALGDT